MFMILLYKIIYKYICEKLKEIKTKQFIHVITK